LSGSYIPIGGQRSLAKRKKGNSVENLGRRENCPVFPLRGQKKILPKFPDGGKGGPLCLLVAQKERVAA